MTTTEQAPVPATEPDGQGGGRLHGGRRPLAAVAGLLSAGVALGVAELAAALVGPASSPVVAVGDTVITLVPEPVKQFAIATFGEDDKIALVVGTLVVVALYAVLVGLVSLRSRRSGVAGIALFGLIGAVAAVTRPSGGLLDALPSVVGALAGTVALLVLVRSLTLLAAPGTPFHRPRTTTAGTPTSWSSSACAAPWPWPTARAAAWTAVASSSPAGPPSARPR